MKRALWITWKRSLLFIANSMVFFLDCKLPGRPNGIHRHRTCPGRPQVSGANSNSSGWRFWKNAKSTRRQNNQKIEMDRIWISLDESTQQQQKMTPIPTLQPLPRLEAKHTTTNQSRIHLRVSSLASACHCLRFYGTKGSSSPQKKRDFCREPIFFTPRKKMKSQQLLIIYVRKFIGVISVHLYPFLWGPPCRSSHVKPGWKVFFLVNWSEVEVRVPVLVGWGLVRWCCG